MSMISIYAGVGYWLGFQLLGYFKGSYLGFAVGIWLAAPVMYALNFFRPIIERAILEDLEDSLLI